MLIRNYYRTAVRQITRNRFQTSTAALANPVNSLRTE